MWHTSMTAFGFSTANVARLDNAKIKALDWRAKYDIERGVKETIDVLKTVCNEI